MKRLVTAVVVLIGMIYFIAANFAMAQWPDDPTVNMVICNHNGEQVVPKIVPTPDGGCYIGWWDNASGNYDVYLQRLNGAGEIQWAENGMLISNHQMETSLTDWDMAIDSEGYAILAVNDIRNSADRDIFAYRISPAGEFAWGANGIPISTGSGFTPDPRVVVTSDGNIVFGWQQGDVTSVIKIRKVRPDGSDFWDPSIITISYTYSLTIARLAAINNDGFVIQYLQDRSSPHYSSPRYLLAQKYDANGVAQWAGSGVTISNGGGFGMGARPDIIYDGVGGTYSHWYETRAGYFHNYVQHIDSSGAMLWTANGVQLSTTAGQMQGEPAFTTVPDSKNVIAFYEITDNNQTVFGMAGQKLDSLGVRQWGNGGIIYRPLGNHQPALMHALPQEGGAMAIFLEGPDGDYSRDYTKAFRVDGAGALIWDPSIINIGATLSVKGHPATTSNIFGQAIAVWEDNRDNPSCDLILQSINPDGSFGPIILPFGTIAGNVIDQSSAPLVNVIDSVFTSADVFAGVDTTDVLGNYSINLQPNTYYVKFSKDAFRDTVVTGIVVLADQTTTVNMQMQAAAECNYTPGDINASGIPNGVDIVLAVSFLKGTALIPIDCHSCCPNTPNPFYAAMDVNGNCSVNGIDITYYVRYLKLQVPALLYCPSCPPSPTASCP